MNQITESELEIMKVLWKLNSATSSQIIENLEGESDWKPKTIQTLITRLVAKEAIEVDKSNKKSYIYYPKVSEEQYKSYANDSFLKKLYNGSINLMLSSFIKDKKLSQDEINDLRKLLDDE
ncbi:MAG: BlaI/MecI/CopY family transcriptional regulator [Peptostreptococcaceae bacterium]